MQTVNAQASTRTVLDMNGYQWTVLLAAWLGWGFDIFDGLLFNYVAPNCVPTLLHLTIGSPHAKAATLLWTGIFTSILLVGWAAGGMVFGRVADTVGRTKTLMLTMLLYAAGTAACAFAPNLGVLLLCRIVSSFGIGGEWAAGAAMVAEVVPEKRRVEAGALLYTSAPAGLFLSTFANHVIAGQYLVNRPDISWRAVFLCGLLPAVVALIVRAFVREPERWQPARTAGVPPVSALFETANRAATFSGLAMALVALIAWWSSNAFLPVVVTNLAQVAAHGRGLSPSTTLHLVETWKNTAANNFNWGGLIGTLLTVPIAKRWGRRPMFSLFFVASSLSLLLAFGGRWRPETQLAFYFPIGLSVFGVFGSFTYYLPELFATRLRATGAGFCYNSGRVIAAIGPFVVGSIAARGADALHATFSALFVVGFVPLVGAVLTPFVRETKNQALPE